MPQLAEFKQAARTTWATVDHDAMMRQEKLYELGARPVRWAGIGPDDEVLDVACGMGNAAIPAAQTDARVTGVHLTPELLEVARRRATAAGVDVDWTEGDAEDLPFDDERFEGVLSSFGCMFAPGHEVAADEMARVLRPAGRLAVASWTPEGAIGDIIHTVGALLPPIPEFGDPPPLWGTEPHLRELFEGTGISLEFERESWDIGHDSVEAAVECDTTTFGAVVKAQQTAEAAGRWPRLREGMLALFDRLDTCDNERVVFPAEYLVAVGHKAW